jgi:hypothetical protein
LIATSFPPQFPPLGVDAFIERHTYCVHLIDGPIEMGLEIAVRSKGFTDMTSPSMFRVQLDRLEIVDIIYDEQSIWIEHNRVGMKK